MRIIKVENFKATDGQAGTAQVTLDGVTRELRAFKLDDRLVVFGVAVKVGRTGSKVWNGELIHWPKSNHYTVSRGGNYRNPYGSGLYVVGFYQDFEESRKSQHAGERR